jgi:hypothetical protein
MLRRRSGAQFQSLPLPLSYSIYDKAAVLARMVVNATSWVRMRWQNYTRQNNTGQGFEVVIQF